ncbi:MAG TPA: hypothetical protein VGC36_16065 [Rhizomicrobium sp.]
MRAPVAGSAASLDTFGFLRRGTMAAQFEIRGVSIPRRPRLAVLVAVSWGEAEEARTMRATRADAALVLEMIAFAQATALPSGDGRRWAAARHGGNLAGARRAGQSVLWPDG